MVNNSVYTYQCVGKVRSFGTVSCVSASVSLNYCSH